MNLMSFFVTGKTDNPVRLQKNKDKMDWKTYLLNYMNRHYVLVTFLMMLLFALCLFIVFNDISTTESGLVYYHNGV